MIIAFLFYAILAYEKFHRTALLLDSGDKPILSCSPFKKSGISVPCSIRCPFRLSRVRILSLFFEVCFEVLVQSCPF